MPFIADQSPPPDLVESLTALLRGGTLTPAALQGAVLLAIMQYREGLLAPPPARDLVPALGELYTHLEALGLPVSDVDALTEQVLRRLQTHQRPRSPLPGH